MQYLLDTVTLIRHFTEFGKLGTKAQEILDNENNTFIISVVSLIEILYLSENRRLNIDLIETLSRIKLSSLYQIVDLTPDILIVANDLHFHELHDRLILSTVKWLGIPIISSDKKFKSIEGINVIWN